MTLEDRQRFWSGLARILVANPLGDYANWSTSGGHKRAFRSSAGMNGIGYRFLIREGDGLGADIPAVEVQVDSPGERRNAQVLEYLLSGCNQMPTEWWNKLVWDADRRPGISRRRRCVRLYVDGFRISDDASEWPSIHQAMIAHMLILMAAFDPILSTVSDHV